MSRPITVTIVPPVPAMFVRVALLTLTTLPSCVTLCDRDPTPPGVDVLNTVAAMLSPLPRPIPPFDTTLLSDTHCVVPTHPLPPIRILLE